MGIPTATRRSERMLREVLQLQYWWGIRFTYVNEAVQFRERSATQMVTPVAGCCSHSMRSRSNFVISILATLLLAACGSPERDVLTLPTAPSSTVPMGSDFTLAPGESVVVNSGELTLTFVRVTNESRCPTEALIQCVWEGSAILALRSVAGTATSDVTLETTATKNFKVIGNYVVQLVAVTPAPRTLDSIPPATYRAVLRINRK